MQSIIALICGLIFGCGLILSGMTNPANVLGFLDVVGAWKPALLFVLGGAVCVAFVAVRLQKLMKRPLFAESFQTPPRKTVDARLVIGSCIFGLGWGLVGLCPGPVIASLALGSWQVWVFLAAMLAGMSFYRLFQPSKC
ncbi:YeeE/YedE family protein [Neokomagataea tanensis]|uniref:YeeE/YedE family protein n=1 Tax=Neokomagataea tanensis TaxID=661191 RepID=A0A4Y6V521_9PROT|nr:MULTISPECIES: DUF6691 family protein [Neokomagataea]QDH25023.1 YeeE/YedE family protein [Neokomagataea tanensis]